MGNFLGKTISNLIEIDLNGRFGAKGFAFNFGCDGKDEMLEENWG
jgi:hypothetical protein